MLQGSPQLRLSSEIGELEDVVGLFFLKKNRKSEISKSMKISKSTKISTFSDVFLFFFEKSKFFFLSSFFFKKQS